LCLWRSAISIAVALWLTGITSGFTQTENLQIVSAYAVWDGKSKWNVTLVIKNTGTTTATIDNIFVNGQPISTLSTGISGLEYKINSGSWTPIANLNSISIQIRPGEKATISFNITKGTVGSITFDHGLTVNIKIHTASGRDYPANIVLP